MKPEEHQIATVASAGNAPIFVVGSARAGTTLLQRMLRSHPGISSPTGESHFFIPLLERAEEFAPLDRRENVRRVLAEMHRISRELMEEDFHGLTYDLDAWAERLHGDGCDTMPALISGLFAMNARAEGKRRWLDKTPYYILHLDRLLDIFPTAKVVHIIRDGRDCAVSMLARRYDLHLFNIQDAAATWKKYVDAGQAFGTRRGPDVYHELRYEDLLVDPEARMREVCGFLGEPFDPRVVEFEKSRDPRSKTPLLSKPLQTENREKWRRSLSPRQIRHFEAIAGAPLERNGYAVDHPDIDALPAALRIGYEVHHRAMERYTRMRRLRR